MAIPAFNKVNSVDAAGRTCPRLPARNQACPLLCVPNPQQDCPEPVRPVCASNEMFCGDGTCRKSCRGIVNACACGEPSSTDPAVRHYQPCMADQVTHLPLLDPNRRQNQTLTACAADLQLDPTRIGTAIGRPLTAEAPVHAWLQCPPRPPPQFTYTEATFIAVYVYVGVVVALLTGWHLYKRVYEARVNTPWLSRKAKTRHQQQQQQQQQQHTSPHDAKRKETKDTSDHSSTTTAPSTLDTNRSDIDSDCQFRGYRRSVMGQLAFAILHLTTLVFFLILAIIVVDYYGLVTGVSYGVMLSSDLSSAVFVALWHVLAVWLVVLNLLHSQLSNYFRLGTTLSQAHFVRVAKPHPATSMLDIDGSAADATSWVNRTMHIMNRTVPMQTTRDGLKYFEFQCTRYVPDAATGQFMPYCHYLGSTYGELRKHIDGLSATRSTELRDLVGWNFIRVHVPSFPVALLEEFRAFFYIYQVMCLWVWYYFAYANVAIVQTVVILVSALVKVAIRLHSNRKVKKLAEHRDVCRVYRDRQWHDDVSTTDLVPGDIIDVTAAVNRTMPCDAALLTGEAMVNESALTGEPVPVRKSAVPSTGGEAHTAFKPYDTSKSMTLFAGTTVLQTIAPESGRDAGGHGAVVAALVIATGTATDKGKLVRKILFPSPVSFIFNEHIRLVFCVLLLWGVVCFGLTIWLMGRGNIGGWFYGLFVISYIMSPLLPASLVVGQSVAAARLRHKQIVCVDLPRVVMAGKVQVFCFDKTGTLTEEGLDYYGMHAAIARDGDGGDGDDDKNGKGDAMVVATREAQVERLPRLLQMALAACHSVTTVNGEMVGNPVDVEQFRVTGWSWSTSEAAPSGDVNQFTPPASFPRTQDAAVHVVKRYDFVRARASMSVVVQDPLDQHLHVFVKGSFERVKAMSRPASLPERIDEQVSQYAAEGCYVLAIAHRDLGPVSPAAMDDMSQDDLEHGGDFQGLLLFKNQLKPDTADAIAELKRGSTRTVMVTGDHALTGIYIARQCGILPAETRVLLADVAPSTGALYWHDPNDDQRDGCVGDIRAMLTNDKARDASPLELAVTGKAFGLLCQTGEMRDLLPHTRIFARMTPDDKVQCVQLHMERAITAMCGDGGNDCGALRAAHCGLALGNADASIVSPFSTRLSSIHCCVELLRQGRAALASSFAGYKFLITYGEIMAFRGLMQAYFSVVMSQWVYILIDNIVTICLSFALTQAKPARRLAALRPTARLFGPQTLASVFGQVLVNMAFLFGAYGLLFRQSWFRCREFDGTTVDNTKWWLMGDNFEAPIIACMSLFQFLAAAFAYNFGHRFRQSWWRNWRLLIVWLAVYVFISFLVLADPNRVGCLFRMNCGDADVLEEQGYPRPDWFIERYNSPLGHNVYPAAFRWKLWGLAQANLVAIIIYERLGVLGPLRDWILRRHAAPSASARPQWTP
ncbi:hypothetical protein SYNPS1DRAFT_32456 [Syncephalis pseudoplumigaleata]|uniref:P-type ATPase A domain-containing protein n=1 Tax=Syncephalis pseudoplumigaleata TaxID=1712513 RepID=A0A4V1J261_9FUNG|nr:hypothetical protein SYNPS1DRAFT_32456 [Syncephalis pseudoplumigaleata]|eukprot:RKP27439.1 hypothetical protein SYNPS1DRAFT_32456 [Syncephalis pseudoplumigaleata]